MHPEKTKRIRIAVVGLRFGESIVRELLDAKNKELFELTGVCDINSEQARTIAAKYSVEIYPSLDIILLDTSIQAVALITPPAGRAALLKKVIAAGKDVMTTKPFDVDADAGLEILVEAEKLGRVIHLNSPSPTPSADLRQIQTIIDTRDLGRPIACRADVWANYREVPDGTWYDDPARCPVAPIFRLGIYLINDIVRFFGEPASVNVIHSQVFTKRPTPDNAQMTIGFTNGAIATIFASFAINDGQPYRNSLTMNFENGTIYRNVTPLPADTMAHGAQITFAGLRDGKRVVEEFTTDQYSGEYLWHEFYHAVNGEKMAGALTPKQIVDGIRVINAMRRAELSGKTEAI